MSHYDTLEVSPNASAETIRAAYKSLMQRYHPDRNLEDAGATERAVSIQHAYEVLSDPGKRAAYDLGREPPLSPSAYRQAPSPVPEQETPLFSSMLLVMSFVVVAGVMGGYLMRDTPQPVQIKPATDSVHAPAQTQSRMFDLIDDVEVIPLLGDDAFRTFTGHTLAIPKLQIVIGQEDETRMREFILIHTDDLKQQLRDALSGIPYETLLKDTAEEYIKARVKEVLNEYILLASAVSPLPDVQIVPLRGNIVKVLLPDSFDVK
ncbi:MAG: J domain-containing protein [Gammaproteobacteria bacterium]|nr:J domain-containing protein [Gammaproteobacteria bacterium]MBU1447534.1 J domain-containing protein [Gammaproteobacteria bacterium]